ncbi:hypothetical protein P5V15_014072 [Pogonomyrmex californicus]
MRLFNEILRNENNKISKITVARTIEHFEEIDSVRNRPKSALDILQSFVKNSHTSINRVAQQHEIGAASTQFCNLILEMIIDDPLFLDNILTGKVNRHNCRYWSNINPYWMRENNIQHPQNHIQHPQKINVRRSHIEWPSRSLDLNPLDYFLGGYLKNKVYITKPQGLDDLRQRIIYEINLMSQIYRNAISDFIIY